MTDEYIDTLQTLCFIVSKLREELAAQTGAIEKLQDEVERLKDRHKELMKLLGQ